MNVDLLSELDARNAEQPKGRDASENGSGFPELLEAKIVDPKASDREGHFDGRDDSATQSASDSTQDETAKADSDSLDSPTGSERAPQQTNDASDSPTNETKESDEAESTAEAAVLGAVSGGLISPIQVTAGADSDVEVEGRVTDLEALAEGRLKGGSDRNAQETEASKLATSEEEATEVDEKTRQTLESIVSQVASSKDGINGTDDSTTAELPALARTPAEAVSNDSGATNRPEVLDGVDESIAVRDENLDNREEGSGREQAPRENLTDATAQRAAETEANSSAQAVEASLRQAVVNQEEVQRAPEVIPVAGGVTAANPIAGSLTETTTATPGVPQPAPASDAIAVQTEWLTTRGGGTARLVLSPPELGELAIRVTLRGGAVEVVMVAQEAVAQSVAEDQADRLAQALGARDLRMESFEVRRGDPESLGDGGTGRFAESDERGGGAREGQTGDGGDSGSTRNLLGRRLSGPNMAPEILSAATESGVDLRA